MTPRETAAYHAGIETMRQMALVAAVTIETRPDADGVRQRAAAAALQGLAEGARSMLPARTGGEGKAPHGEAATGGLQR